MKEWAYFIEEVPASMEDFEDRLSEIGGAGWEAVTSWVIPDNKKSHTFILFKMAKEYKK